MGVWQESESGICATVTSYFVELFQSSRSCQIEEIASCMEDRVNLKDNRALTAPVMEDEIVTDAFQIPPSRAPSLDEFSGCFYQDY